MIIGTNKETKSGEHRVALLPSGVRAFVASGHEVLMERGAGADAGWDDDAYVQAGARLVDAETIFATAEMVYKVKEPMAWEYDLMRPNQLLFTYIHSAGNRPLCDKLLEHQVLGVAFEDVELDDGRLPLLEPMSFIAGYMGLFKGFELLQAHSGGKGLLPGGLPGVTPTRVTILGAGFVGHGASSIGCGAGAEVTILDIDTDKLAAFAQRFPTARTRYSSAESIEQALRETDLLLNGVMWPKTRKGHLVTREMLGQLPRGAVIVDVSADIRGAIESCERQTTHDDPTYAVDGITHYVVANIPALVARSASEALANVTLPYALKLAERGAARALLEDHALRRAVTCFQGEMVRDVTAEWYGAPALNEEALLRGLEASL